MGFLDLFIGKNMAYFPGCLTDTLMKNLKENYKTIFDAIGVKYIELPEKFCCGSPVKNAGYVNEFQHLAKINFETLKKYNVGTLIFNCPACYYVFNHEYPNVVDDWDIKCIHVVDLILDAIKKGKLVIKKKLNIKVTYHDPCHLGRYSGIYDQPREILNLVGCKIIEMDYSRENSFCCGGGNGLPTNALPLANELAKQRIDQAKKTNADVLVSCCPMCVLNLSKNSKSLKVVDISELIIKAIK